MPADPVVSTADTPWPEDVSEAFQDVFHVYPLDRAHHPFAKCPRCVVASLLNERAALLAVGERDKAEIERLRRVLDRTEDEWEREGERDRRQIARLTEALKRAAQGPCLNTMRVEGCAAVIARKKFCPSCTARAVLADEEDAKEDEVTETDTAGRGEL